MDNLIRMCAATLLSAAMSLCLLSCGKDEPDSPASHPVTPPTTDQPETQPNITVTFPNANDNSVNFRQDINKLQVSVAANFSASYELTVSGASDWMFVDKSSGTLTKGASTIITIYANRRGLYPGVYHCTLTIVSGDVRKDIPIEVTVTEFEPLGSYRKISTCDGRLVINFTGCYKRNNRVNLTYTITNNGEDIRGLKFWSNPVYSYFSDDTRRYDKDNGLSSSLGNQSGIGDLSVSFPKGETISCSHSFPVDEKGLSGLLDAFLMIYNYGTGDWECAGKYIHFADLECEDLDNFDPDYRPTPPPAPEPDPQLFVSASSLDFSTDRTALSLSIRADRNVHFKVESSEAWLVPEVIEGDLAGEEERKLTFRVNRYGLSKAEYNATIKLSTPFESIEIPVSMTITEFKPYGSCRELVSCDSRLQMIFNGCYKKGTTVVLEFYIRNVSGEKINGLKLWQHPTFTYFTDNLGNRYNKDTGTVAKLGTKTGTGDLTTAVNNDEAIMCSFTINNVNRNATSFSNGVVRLYNYGTGDFPCREREVSFSDITWTDLDTLFD